MSILTFNFIQFKKKQKQKTLMTNFMSDNNNSQSPFGFITDLSCWYFSNSHLFSFAAIQALSFVVAKTFLSKDDEICGGPESIKGRGKKS